MDSLTQLTLGAAVGEAVLGRRIGYRAALWGAVCGTVPDLDVLVSYGSAVADFTYHRGVSHSLAAAALITPVLVWLILKIHPSTRPLRARWALLVFGALATHMLLDAFTVYGTQILWPFTDTPIMWASIFIIDPAYTLPLLAGVITALVLRRESIWRALAVRAGLALSTLYLAGGVVAKLHVHQEVGKALVARGIEADRLLVQPGPMTSLVWRVLATNDDVYHEGFVSLLDDVASIELTSHPRNLALLSDVADHWPVRRLEWFTHGYYSVRRDGDDVVITDLRIGLEPLYVFAFRVARANGTGTEPVESSLLTPAPRDFEIVRRSWRRIFDPRVVLVPEGGVAPRME